MVWAAKRHWERLFALFQQTWCLPACRSDGLPVRPPDGLRGSYVRRGGSSGGSAGGVYHRAFGTTCACAGSVM